MKKRALITGIKGMDGSHLADFLLSKNYEVLGLTRNNENNSNINHIKNEIILIKGDLSDENLLRNIINQYEPDEIYNFAAESNFSDSWLIPEKTMNINGIAPFKILNIIKDYKNKKIKFFQSSSSEMYGKLKGIVNENTFFNPCSPYGIAKLFAHWATKNYRENYDVYAVNGIFFNHESERRGYKFVTRKISDGVAKIYLGLSNSLTLGNVDAVRDWGYSPDYVEGAWLMLQQEYGDDYVLSTGKSHSVRDFLNEAFNYVGINDWSKYIKIDSKFFRPVEIESLLGDSSKAFKNLGWNPKISFKELVIKMVSNDIFLLKKEIDEKNTICQ